VPQSTAVPRRTRTDPIVPKERPLRLATITHAGRVRVVVDTPRGLVDVGTAVAADPDNVWRAASLRELLAGGTAALDFLARAADDTSAAVLPADEIRFLPPVTDPPRILCVGRNYAEHAREGKAEVPDHPMIFLKPATTLSGHDGRVEVPDSTDKVDWEGEVAVVIGQPGRDIAEDAAWDHIAGLTVGNDLTARDWQRRTSQFDSGKMFDGFGPLGPFLVTPDEITDLPSVRITTRVNGELMQSGSIDEMIFSIPFLVSYLSRAIRLLPGDVILTGTPAGVGYARTPPIYLHDGDVVEVEVEQVGLLRSHITQQPVPGNGDPIRLYGHDVVSDAAV
jgi:acylpyruvate hydrolase